MYLSWRLLIVMIVMTTVNVMMAFPASLNEITSTNYYVVNFDDSFGFERSFDGIGGISGGGATSKLLVNYPEKERNEILDYLFKPNFAASLQILKVEIGGDVQSTDGTEASHMHTSDDENYVRGYEWWLMTEAKKINPDIKLYCLPWGFPGWIGNGTGNPYVNVSRTADYVTRWISAAKRIYNLTIDYVGIWNEKNYDVNYIKTLRKTLDSNGFSNVLIIAADGDWGIANDIAKDKDLADSIYSIGVHYPGTVSSSTAINTGKVLWASEDYSTYNNNVGAGCWARILNQNYVNGYMTSTISWNLIVSYYDSLPFSGDGLMTAVEPWSGFYQVSSPIWITAHTTQFTSIGWKYLKHSSGVGKLPQGGSYVALVSPDGQQLTIVIETMTHDHSPCIRPGLPGYSVQPQNITLKLNGNFNKISAMNVWYSKLNFNGQPSTLFQNLGTIEFISGQATLQLGLDEVYTLTTIANGQKGQYPAPPSSQPFPLPYKDNFESYDLNQEAFNLAQQLGSYEVINEGVNKFIRQMAVDIPVYWCEADRHNRTINVIGQNTWSDIKVQVDVRVPSVYPTSGVFVAARVDRGGCESHNAQGIYFYLLQDNTYQVTTDFTRTKILLRGNLTVAPGWHTLNLSVQRQNAVGKVDGINLFNISIPQSSGFAAIGTDSFGFADFDNLLLDLPSVQEKPQPLVYTPEELLEN